MSTSTDTTTGATQEDPTPGPVPTPELPPVGWTDKDGNVHNHEVHTDCPGGCYQTVP